MSSRREQASAAAALLARYVESFALLGELDDYQWQIPSALLSAGTAVDPTGFASWQPSAAGTPREKLDALYQELNRTSPMPVRFPPLYEQLLLAYRWLRVDLGEYRLLGNPPAEDLAPLLQEMRSDRFLYDALLPAGYAQFAKGPGADFDPICFDLSRRTASGEWPVVKVDHEQILCFNRIRVARQVSGSFRELVLSTVQQAQANSSR